MDADVISIETSRSKMELLEAFRTYKYPNDVGPGVYDIHSPRLQPLARWRTCSRPRDGVCPTGRSVKPALANMVEAAQQIRRLT